MAAFFSFKDFLSESDQVAFFSWSHGQQVAKVSEYLDFLARQPACAHFTSSSRASMSWAVLQHDNSTGTPCHQLLVDTNLLMKLIEGKTRSGFGAFGTNEPGILNQKALSLAVARVIEPIGHSYKVETSSKRRGKDANAKPVLNSRSFFFYWCHAEKQKLLDIRLKLHQALEDQKTPHDRTRARVAAHWRQLRIVVDRAMCDDCIEFARCLAAHDQVEICIQDPHHIRVFPPQRAGAIIESPVEVA